MDAFAEPLETVWSAKGGDVVIVVEGRGLFRNPDSFHDDIGTLRTRAAAVVEEGGTELLLNGMNSWKPVESVRFEVDAIPEEDGRPLREHVAEARDPMEAAAIVAWRMAMWTHPPHRPNKHFERIVGMYSFQAHRRDFEGDGMDTARKLGLPDVAYAPPTPVELKLTFSSSDEAIADMNLEYVTKDLDGPVERLLASAAETVSRRFVAPGGLDESERLEEIMASLTLEKLTHTGGRGGEMVVWWRTEEGPIAQGRIPSGFAGLPVDARIRLALEAVPIASRKGLPGLALVADVADRIDVDDRIAPGRRRPPSETKARIGNAAVRMASDPKSTDEEAAFAKGILRRLNQGTRRLDPLFCREGRIRPSQTRARTPEENPLAIAGDYVDPERKRSPFIAETETVEETPSPRF